MSDHELRVDEPDEMLRALTGMKNGAQLTVGIPVYVKAQDSRDVASSLRRAVFICEELADAFAKPTVEIEKDPTDPNNDLLLLRGKVTDVGTIQGFVTEWRDVLDPDGSQEPFELTSEEAEALYDRLEGEERIKAFRFPELAKWFREVRSHFDAWADDD